jgi:molecular chaperone GrpE (heat shock protein)
MNFKIIIVFLLFGLNGYSQTPRIDKLRNSLPSLNGREAVDCLNALATNFNFFFIRADSANHYAKLALEKATMIRYPSGEAVALLTLGDVNGRLLGNMAIMQSNSQKAIPLLQQEKDTRNLSLAYYKLAVSYFAQGEEADALAAALKAKDIALAQNDTSGIGWAIQANGLIHCHTGEYWKCFENMIESQRIGKAINDSLLISTSLAFIARSFNRVGDPIMALNYYHQSMQFATPFLLLWPHLEDIAYAHLQLKQYDSVLYYQQKHIHNLDLLAVEPAVRKKFEVFNWGYSVEVQLARKEYDLVLSTVLPQIAQLHKNNDVIALMQSLMIAGKCYVAKEDYQLALQFSRKLLTTATRLHNGQYMAEADELLYSVFSQLKQSDSALAYYKNYVSLRDKMAAAQFAQKTALYLAASTAAAKISVLEKDNTIAGQRLLLKTKELLKQQQLRNGFGLGLLALLLLFILVARNNILRQKNDKLQHEQSQLALKRKALELEMQALRAQMNPHFIFNCLSAIDNLIQTSQPDKATSYLSRFANLIRGILDSSKNNLISFQKDFDTLKLYLEMEQFRCNNKFSYHLDADQELLNGDYKVPPLIIQPFVENAIHHGLLNKKDSNRQLTINARLLDMHIVYSITDNGIGRQHAAFINQRNRPDHRSYGIDITRERIKLHNKQNIVGDILITDLGIAGMPMGTTATIKIESLSS